MGSTEISHRKKSAEFGGDGFFVVPNKPGICSITILDGIDTRIDLTSGCHSLRG